MTSELQEQAPNGQQWWLSDNGKPTGPHSESYIMVGLKTGAVSPQTYACPVKGQEWKRLSDWPAFASGSSPASPPPPPPPTFASGEMRGQPTDSPFTNPALPPMANWLCLYTITVSPVYWFVSQFSCLVTGSTFRDDSDFFGLEVLLFLLTFIVSLSVAIVLLVGGLRLRALRASGVTWLKIGLSADLILPIVIGILALVVSAVASETDFRQSTTGQDLVGFVVMTLGFSLYLFEVFGLIWLHRHAALLGSLKNR